jgi:hypothetical protein
VYEEPKPCAPQAGVRRAGAVRGPPGTAGETCPCPTKPFDVHGGLACCKTAGGAEPPTASASGLSIMFARYLQVPASRFRGRTVYRTGHLPLSSWFTSDAGETPALRHALRTALAFGTRLRVGSPRMPAPCGRLWLSVHGCRSVHLGCRRRADGFGSACHGYESVHVGCRRDAGAPACGAHGSGSPYTAMVPSTPDAGETPATHRPGGRRLMATDDP